MNRPCLTPPAAIRTNRRRSPGAPLTSDFALPDIFTCTAF